MFGTRRVTPWILLLAALGFALASCSGSGGDEELDDALAALNISVAALSQEAGGLEGDLHELEISIASIVTDADISLDGGRVGPSRAGFLPTPPDGQVTVQFVAESLDAAIPGEFRFFLAPAGEDLFETRSLAEGEAYEVGGELADGIAFVEPGVLYRLKVVYENPTGVEQRFLVPGGTLDPQGVLPFVRNRCWCAAIPFTAPPNGTFTRVIDVGVGPDTPPGARAIMVWPVASLES